MLFGYFTLLVALTISAVAEFYSIVGLTAIFSAAFWPVVIMGASLGIGKITAAVWLKLNWERANWTYKLYLVPAVAFLMLLTSMGIFGFLSKAHSDQSLVGGDVQSRIAVYDDKIQTAKENIDANRKALKQMDEAVDQVMGRSSDEKGADKAVAVRRAQQKERARLQSEIASEQKTIAAISQERAPIAAEVRKVEAEVGPIKYIAALIYGDNPDANVLEKAVRLVIIMIVLVFDPLALVLILAAQQSIRWSKEEKNIKDDQAAMAIVPPSEEDTRPFTEEEIAALDQPVEDHRTLLEKHPYLLWPFSHFTNTTPMPSSPQASTEEADYEQDDAPLTEEQIEQLKRSVEAFALCQNEVDAEAEQAAQQTEILATGIDDVERPGDYITSLDYDEEDPAVKLAIKQWKAVNPDDTIKNQRYKFMRGEIVELPWMGLVADNSQGREGQSGFGISFPENPEKGDVFVRVDIMPSVLYKYNGTNWISIDKNLSDSYTYDSAYIEHLIDKISTGEYDPDLLSDSESQRVAQYLTTKTSE